LVPNPIYLSPFIGMLLSQLAGQPTACDCLHLSSCVHRSILLNPRETQSILLLILLLYPINPPHSSLLPPLEFLLSPISVLPPPMSYCLHQYELCLLHLSRLLTLITSLLLHYVHTDHCYGDEYNKCMKWRGPHTAMISLVIVTGAGYVCNAPGEPRRTLRSGRSTQELTSKACCTHNYWCCSLRMTSRQAMNSYVSTISLVP
jgi:hypothetical protein